MAYTPTDNPYIPGDPYSYDLKWIVAKIKEALSSIEGLTTGQSDLSNDFEALREYVYNYFDNLDISQEVEDKINELYAAGFFDDIIEEWMNGHIKWTNPNLLDNPWFTPGSVVNQRGFTSIEGTSRGYVIMDRWKSTYDSDGYIASLGASGYSQRRTTAGTYAAFEQVLESSLLSFIDGKIITASLMLADDTIISGSIARTNGTKQYFYNASIGGAALQLTMETGNTFRITSYGVGHTIKAVKLEMGPYSTLGNDAPSDYKSELDKCQYYFRRLKPISSSTLLGMGYIGPGGTSAGFPAAFPAMKTTPTVTKNGGMYIRVAGSDSNHAFTDQSAYMTSLHTSLSINGITGVTAGDIVWLVGTSGCYLDFSADL